MSRYQQELDWHGLYVGNTSRDDALFTPESTRHPAKMSNPLLLRILATMQEFGWLKPGDLLADPFGGTGRTALIWCAKHPDNRAATIEIEPEFVRMQRENKALAERKFGREFRWGIHEGDSRKCDEILCAGAAVTSPPYAGSMADEKRPNKEREEYRDPSSQRDYGSHPAQIGNLPDAAVTSPPYAASLASDDPDKRGGLYRDPKRRNDRTLTADYGQAAGQIGTLPDAAVTSPPYEAQSGGSGEATRKRLPDAGVTDRCGYKQGSHDGEEPTAGQIGITWMRAQVV